MSKLAKGPVSYLYILVCCPELIESTKKDKKQLKQSHIYCPYQHTVIKKHAFIVMIDRMNSYKNTVTLSEMVK